MHTQAHMHKRMLTLAHRYRYTCMRTYTCAHTHENAHPELDWACFAHLDLKDDVKIHHELLCPPVRLRGELFV